MSHSEFNMALLVAIAVVAVLVIVVALPVVLSMRQAARDRELLHAERQKALEMGRPLPGESASQGAIRGAGVGVWVPICALGIALAATQDSTNAQASAVAAWISAGCVGVAGVVCGTVLTLHNARREGRAAGRQAPAKPFLDDAEIDTVGRRGY